MNKKIIIFNNLEEQNSFLSRFLHEANYEIVITEKESDLLDLINFENPDLILLSSILAGKDSYLICKNIKLLEKSEDIPVIFLEQAEHNLDLHALFSAGGVDYFSYPLNPSEILHKITQQLLIIDLQKELQAKNNQLFKLIPHYQNLKEVLEITKTELSKLTEKSDIIILSNQEKFEQALEKEWLRGARQRAYFADSSGTSISLLIAKINDFSAYQANYKPEVVNNCLKIITANLYKTPKRAADMVAKLAYDKFALVLPNTDQQGALKIAKNINKLLTNLQIPHSFSQVSKYVTMSIGIATGIPSQAIPSTILVDVAEAALENALGKKEEQAIVTDSF
jgi:diguanylate cyclase (GGDEF)-like protein